jgi:hypothetical protein
VSWVRAEEVLKTVAAHREVIAEQERRAGEFLRYHEDERAKVAASEAEARADLGKALLPSLDPAVIATAAAWSGLAGLPAEDLPARVVERRTWLAARIQQIEVDPGFTGRALLRHPVTGSLTRELAENEELRRPALDVITTCESHERFARLWETGFGTAEAGTPFWRYSYWQDRFAADAVVALFPGKEAFAEVRAEYETAKNNLQVFDGEVARIKGAIAAGEALEREHEAARYEFTHVAAVMLDRTRARVVTHLLETDASLVSQRFLRWPDARLLFLRASGLASKLTYLDGIGKKHLEEVRADVKTLRERVDAVEFRTRRRWAPMPADKYAKFAVDRGPRFQKRWERTGKVYQTVNSYDRWDRGRYYDDLLWWDLMTRGRYDGSYLDDVAAFHRGRPDYRFDPDYKARARARREAEDEVDADVIDDDAFAASSSIDADTSDGGASDAGHGHHGHGHDSHDGTDPS